MANVVEQVLVLFGLDPRNFTRGAHIVRQESRRTREQIQSDGKAINRSQGEAAERTSNSFGILARRAALLYIAFRAIKYGAKETLEASRATRELGNNSRAYDIAANRLRNFQNVAEMAGGSAEDATKTIGNLQKSIFNLAYNGQMSDSLIQLGRLGVQFQDASGHARNFNDVFLDTAGAIEQLRASGKMTEGEAFQFLQSAGLDPALSRVALGGRASAQAELTRQEQRRQVSGADVAAATANERAITSLGQAKDAAFVAASTKASPLITGAVGGAEHLLNAATGQESVEAMVGAWEKAIEPVTTKLGDIADTLKQATASLMPKGKFLYEAPIAAAAKKYGLDPKVLEGLIKTESNFDPSARSSAGAVGIAQLMPQYFPNAGKNPFADIDDAAKHLATLKAHFAKNGASGDDDAMYLALAAYNAGESRVRGSNLMKSGGQPLADETADYPGKVLDYAAGVNAGPGRGGGTTNIDIGEVNVHTQATDADGMASGASDALRRKLNAANAEQGMQ